MAELRTSFDEALATLGALLVERGLRYELYAVGGGALQLLGLIRRPTRDIDVTGLLAGRTDQISFKLYAAVDLGPDSKHFSDLRQLEPTTEELLIAGRWARTHDPSDGFRGQLVRALRDMGVPDADV